MTIRTVLPVLCVSLSIAGAIAQTAPEQAPPAQAGQSKPEAAKPEAAKPASAKPAARETPPDMKAFNEATATKDFGKRIEALEKWKADFPSSQMLASADMAILNAMQHQKPPDLARIRAFADGMYREAEPKSRGSVANTIATDYLNNDQLLKDAERYARKSVESMRLAGYLDDQMASFAKRKQKPPSPEELQKRFLDSRATRLGTLGRIEVKLGHIAKGQKLLEEAYAVNPKNAVVGAVLGELAAKAGDDAKAMEYLIPARLSGRPEKSANDALAAIYRKTHGGSLDGLEATLDAEYRKRFPNPLELPVYAATEKRSDRVVLAEVFTGSGCPPCVGADLAFDAALERYSRKELAVVMYHQHIPRPDPMTNPDTQARAKSYSVNGVPTFAIDGKKTVGGGPRENTKQVYERFDKDLEKDLETPAEAHLQAEASLTGNTVKVRASVEGVKSESKDLKVHMLLVEKELHYSGENGVRFHPMVVRAMGGENAGGFALDGSAGMSFEQSFDLDTVSKALKAHLDDYEAKGHRGETFTFIEKKDRINRANLAVVVFVQDDESKHVLQAAYIDLGVEPVRPVTEANGSK
jgi:thiol-disulfide isomerase/thioredoxin